MQNHIRLPRLFRLAFVLLAAVPALRAQPADAKSTDTPPSVLKRYDKNKDGVLDEAERSKWEADKAARREKDKARRAEMLEKYDTDKDGKLSEEEKAAAKLGWQKERTEKEAEKMKERAAREKAERQASEQAAEAGGEAAAKKENAAPAATGRESGEKKAAKNDSEGMMMMQE